MKILSIEQSTPIASAALLENNVILADTSWIIDNSRQARMSTDAKISLFSLLPNLLKDAKSSISAIDAFSVGLGPGSFAGIRSTISAANAMALPDKKPVVGVSSIMALAYAVMNDYNLNSAAIIGDARRNRFWFAIFARKQDTIETITEPKLIEPEKLAYHLNDTPILATPDWERIGDFIENTSLNTQIVRKTITPSAKIVGQLASQMLMSKQPIPKPLPIYMHPPVFVEPRFPKKPLV